MSRPPSRPIALVIAFTLAVGGLVVSAITGLVGGFVGGVLSVLSGGGDTTATGAFLVVALLVASEVGFVVVGYAFRRTDDGGDLVIDWANGVPSAREVGLIVAATVGLVVVNRAGFWLGSLVGINPVTAVSPPEEGSTAIVLLLIPTMLFVVGPAEEYLFRGVIQSYLERAFSLRGALGLSAVLFALVHIPNLVTNPTAAPVSIPIWLAIGLVLGWLYQRTETLLAPIAVHGLYNVAVIGILLGELGLT